MTVVGFNASRTTNEPIVLADMQCLRLIFNAKCVILQHDFYYVCDNIKLVLCKKQTMAITFRN
jgi:hypothetical protein